MGPHGCVGDEKTGLGEEKDRKIDSWRGRLSSGMRMKHNSVMGTWWGLFNQSRG